MKPFFSKHSQGASESRNLAPCNCVRVYSVSGTVTIQFNDGDLIPLLTGDVFKCDFPAQFDKITVTTGSGASVVLISGNGAISNISSSSSGSGGVQSTSGDPEGVLNAASGQWAYDTATGALYINPNSTGTTGWVNLIA